MTVFLDIDGVLADFTGALASLIGLDPDDIHDRWPAGDYGLGWLAVEAGWSDKPDEGMVWARIDAAGVWWWADLPLLPWFGELLDLLAAGEGEVVLLTSPSRDPAAASGKMHWIQRHFGGHAFRRFLIGPPKYAVARPGALLIDDSDRQVAGWRRPPCGREGGLGVLFPRPWNVAHERSADPLAAVREAIGG